MTSPAPSPPVEAAEAQSHRKDLVRVLEALSNATRLEILDRLARPAFIPDLARALGVTRQTIRKHLDALEEVGLIIARPSRRGALPATEYLANPAGLFTFKEGIQSLALVADASLLPPQPTLRGAEATSDARLEGRGLLLVHGDAPGRWFPLAAGSSWVLGREAGDDVALPYDPFASGRHALLRRDASGWTVVDLQSTNGTFVNFRPLARGESRVVRPGDLLTIGHSHLLLRDGP